MTSRFAAWAELEKRRRADGLSLSERIDRLHAKGKKKVRPSRFVANLNARARVVEHRGAQFRVPAAPVSKGQDVAVEVGVEIEKLAVDADQQWFIGWASVTSVDGQPVTDHQGDVIDVAELEQTAAAFMQEHAIGLAMHEGTPAITYTSSLVISAAVKKALGMTLDPDREGWVVCGTVHDPAVWARIKSGELRALSIGGTALRSPID